MENMDEIMRLKQHNYPNVNIAEYFDQNISFELDNEKRTGMKKFLELAQKLELAEIKLK